MLKKAHPHADQSLRQPAPKRAPWPRGGREQKPLQKKDPWWKAIADMGRLGLPYK